MAPKNGSMAYAFILDILKSCKDIFMKMYDNLIEFSASTIPFHVRTVSINFDWHETNIVRLKKGTNYFHQKLNFKSEFISKCINKLKRAFY